jgi:transcriptional regulator with XRE-family HTH domain
MPPNERSAVKSEMSRARHPLRMDAVRFGLAIRALRRRRGWTQSQIAARARVSQSAVSRAERCDAWDLPVRTLHRIAEALGARAPVSLFWQGEGLDRLLDAAHAGLVDLVVAILVADGWQVIPEATFNHFGERGAIDVLAWHPEHGAPLIVEVKSVMPDVQALLSGVDRKARIGRVLATERGWRVRSVSRLVVFPDDRTVRRRVTEHANTFDLAYPARTRAVWRWLRRPAEPMGGLLFLTTSQSTTTRHRVRGAPRRNGPPERSATGTS